MTVTVTALDQYGNVVPGYSGAVHFTSSDQHAVLPPDYTFVAGDAGVHAFTNGVILKTAGTRTVTVTDTGAGSITGSANVKVSAAAASIFQIAAPASVVAGSPFSITVTAYDAYGNVAKSYLGAVHFTTTDQGNGVALPADYTFTAQDQGRHVFAGVVLTTPGSQTLTATDKTNGTIKGNKKVRVNAAQHASTALRYVWDSYLSSD
jgi:hypothetical protein